MTESVPVADCPAHPVQPDGIRAVGAGDRAAVLDLVGAIGLFPAEELVEVQRMLDAFMTGTAGPGDRWSSTTSVGAWRGSPITRPSG